MPKGAGWKGSLMRRDMFKIIVERPRTGRSYERAAVTREANLDPDELPKMQSMKRRTNQSKQLNENLEPLKRFFRKQVGRPWDKVYSEVCENIDSNSTVQNHVRQHVPDLVHITVGKDESGKVFDKRRSYGGGFSELWHGDLYVDPKTGILRKYKSEKRRYSYTKPTPEERFSRDLGELDIVLFQGALYKAERSKIRSPKYDKEQVAMVLANKTHAENDFRCIPERLRGFVKAWTNRALYREHEYIRTAWDLIQAYDERRQAQREAEERKKAEGACKSSATV